MAHLWPVHGDDEIEAVTRVLRSGRTNYWSLEYGEGKMFEREFAEYTGARHALTCSNGTTALELALYGAFGPDALLDMEVIVPCRTFMATASCVDTFGMIPVLADIDPVTLNVTVETLEARRNARTRAVIVVHFGGLPCDMEAIRAWADRHELLLIEDCAHAHGARIDGQHVGTFGHVGAFSFCLGKIMSTGGEGGMVICNDDKIAARMAARRDHGRYQMTGSRDMTQFYYEVEAYGTNARMTEMQAAIGRCQLRKLDGWNERRAAVATMYRNGIQLSGVRHPVNATGRAWYLYVMQVFGGNQADILARLNARGIAARIGGCPNLGHEPVFRGTQPACPVADKVGERTIALPIYPTMTVDMVEEIIAGVNEELGR